MSIRNNTAKLEALLGKINDLPLSGSGGAATTLGTWLLQEELVPTRFTANFAFQVDGVEYSQMSADNTNGMQLYYDGELVYDDGWQSDEYRKVSILEEISNGACATWLINNGDYLNYLDGYEDGLLTVEEEVNIQMNLVDNIQNLLEELPDAGSGGSSEPTLWGSYALRTYLLAEDFIQETYNLSGLGIYAYFWDGENWLYESITNIEVCPGDGYMLVFGEEGMKDCYFEDGWYDGNGEQYNHNRLLVIEVPAPVTVSQDIYSLFENMVSVDNEQPFDLGYALGASEGGGTSGSYDEGYADGQNSVLVEFADWSLSTTSNSCTVSIANTHPSLYLHLNFEVGEWASVGDAYYGSVIVPPNSSYSWDSDDWVDSAPSGAEWEIFIGEMRFSKDGV